MMLVKTRVAMSPIEGLGIFADEDIKKGAPTWKFIPGLDFLVEPAFVETLASPMKEFCLRYAYMSPLSRRYVLCGDNARFMNHSDTPNTKGAYPDGEPEGMDVAIRDIAAGEELTCDYREFAGDISIHLATIAAPPEPWMHGAAQRPVRRRRIAKNAEGPPAD